MQTHKMFILILLSAMCYRHALAQDVASNKGNWIIGSIAVVLNPANTVFAKGDRVKILGAVGDTITIARSGGNKPLASDHIAAQNLQPLAIKLASYVDESYEILVYSADGGWVSPPTKDGKTSLELVAPGERKPYSVVLRPYKSLLWPVPKSGSYRVFYNRSGRLVELYCPPIPSKDNDGNDAYVAHVVFSGASAAPKPPQ